MNRRHLLSRIVRTLAGGGVAAVALNEMADSADAASCYWLNTGSWCSCGAYASCWMSGGYGRRVQQRRYCDGIPTGETRCAFSACGC